jgi:Fe-S-cluster containining protein
MSQCTGKCCAAFHLPSYDRLMEDPLRIEDGMEIVTMILPLSIEEAKAVQEEEGLDFGLKDPLFTCRWWNKETRLCMNYDHRPRMCQNYPYENECSHGCGFCGGKELRTE